MPKRLPRKLTAILYADVAGYSRLTGEDEDGTHRMLRTYLDLIASQIQAHRGRVVHYAGDAVLADFGTVVEALGCATAIQTEIGERNEEVPHQRRVQFRIGVNLGDVIVDGEEICGDGVNVAARLESLAEPGGICISDAVRTAVGRKLGFVLERFAEAIAHSERALALNPYDGDVLVMHCMTLTQAGRAQEAVAWIDKALRYNPQPPAYYRQSLMSAQFLAGDEEDALSTLRRLEGRLPPKIRYLAVAVLQTCNRHEEARERVRVLLASEPDAGIASAASAWRPYSDRRRIETLLEALRDAGLPERVAR